MRIQALFVLTLALAVPAAQSFAAAKVYQWTDAEGVVHFSSSPPGNQAGNATVEERLVEPVPAVGTVPTELDEIEVDPEAEARAETEKSEKRAMAANRALACADARRLVEMVTPAQRVRIRSADGSDQWLYGEDRVAYLNKQRERVAENCG